MFVVTHPSLQRVVSCKESEDLAKTMLAKLQDAGTHMEPHIIRKIASVIARGAMAGGGIKR